MFNTEQLSKKIAEQIAKELNKTTDEQEVIAYGLFSILHTLFALVLTYIGGAILGIGVEAVLSSLGIGILRKFSGGAHATSSGRCLGLGIIIAVGLGYLANSLQYTNSLMLIISLLVSIGVCSVVIGLKAPVDHPNKPIKDIVHKEELRNGAFKTVIGLGVLAIGISFFRANYGSAMILGMLWQTFTLTQIGHKVINGLDALLIQINQSFRRKKV